MTKKCLLFAISLFVTGFISCSSSKSQNDSDADFDSHTDSDDLTVIEDTENDLQDSDFIDDSDKMPDQDADTDNDSDTPETVECLDLRYNENTIKTPFPFKDANGKPTFCRPGCDTPTENDPQCVRNIWEWDNWQNYQRYLEAQEKDPNQTTERECYPWPCVLPDMKADPSSEILHSTCDKLLTVNGFTTGALNSQGFYANTHGMSDGVAGMSFAGKNLSRVVEYNPEKDEYSALSQSSYLGFNENRYVTKIYDRNPRQNKDAKFFAVSIQRRDNGYFYEFIYDLSKNGEDFSDAPLAGRNWVVLRLKNSKIIYASSQDWIWYELDGVRNYAGDGNIVGDHVTFVANDYEIYYCDLRKHPKHLESCTKLNRTDSTTGETEHGNTPKIDTDNERRVVYNVLHTPVLVEVDFSTLNRKYTEYHVNQVWDDAYSWEISMLKGNTAAYSEGFFFSNGYSDIYGCFYRFDKKETFCPDEYGFDSRSLMYFNVFGEKWHLWQRVGEPESIIRDLECYCEETGICPLEE
jgi:hypothetical protein